MNKDTAIWVNFTILLITHHVSYFLEPTAVTGMFVGGTLMIYSILFVEKLK